MTKQREQVKMNSLKLHAPPSNQKLNSQLGNQ